MGLFQKSVLTNYLTSVSDSDIDKGWNSLISYKEMDSKVQTFKEEVFQAKFLEKIFVDCFGYKSQYDSAEEGNLFFEQKNTSNSKKADGAIKKDGEVIAVIELKSTKTKNLDDVKNQAFGYYTNNSKCEYVITSNFNKLRFYIERNEDYLEFDLFNIDKEKFKLLWLCLDSKNLLEGKPKEIKNKSLINEEKITKKLYQDYSTFRQELFNNLIENNQTIEKRVILNKTQKLLDRLLFILFSEDRGLLPANSISEIINHWEFGGDSLYSTFLTYFEIINKGRPKRGDKKGIYAYNGGLFSEDVVLNTLNISDDVLLRNAKKLTKYDFESDVSVDILGHIFEHSLSEIEELQNQIDGVETDKSKSKRKKDGVYYTPKYITKYIVDNTLGKLCDEKKIELDINEETYSPSAKRSRNRISALDDYRSWLLQLTICDPACGSGAFLIQALNFLIKEHHYIDELSASYNKDSLLLSDVKNSILENNLYGVDINQESVEIAKLSLWLNTAESNRKLTSLNNNIKCGNSLIDDPEVAGDKAFNWENEFPEVFKNGGFDVVIGNPPYVRQELFKEIKPFLKENYKCYNSIADLYTYFIERGIDLINRDGLFSFILPNKFLKATYGKQIRKVMKEKSNLEMLFDFDDYPVFADATTYPIIFVLNKKNQNDYFSYSEINKRDETLDPLYTLESKKFNVSFDSLNDDMWNFINNQNKLVLDKINDSSVFLKDLVENKIFAGIASGKNDVFIVNDASCFNSDDKAKNILKLILGGSEIDRYNINPLNNQILFIPWDYDLEYSESIKHYLEENREGLEKRPEVKLGRFKWWCLSRYGSNNSYLLNEPKIIAPFINSRCNFYLDEKGEVYLQKNSMFISSGSKSLLAYLNSSVSFYYLKNVCTTLQGGYYDFRRDKIQYLPVPKNLEQIDEELTDLGGKQLKTHKEHSLTNKKFTNYLLSQFSIEKLPKKLQNWHQLDFSEFIKELNKSIKKVGGEKLTKSDEMGWMDVFETKKAESQTLKAEIDKTDKEIDQMVYELYGLTKEEIEIVENS